ncbi:MAG TPA: hypothetical protein VEO54_27645 [Thermoanaerobaculia bacterium]|nr:hypothetical protein [Thermoanaerobaculia bacterium]
MLLFARLVLLFARLVLMVVRLALILAPPDCRFARLMLGVVHFRAAMSSQEANHREPARNNTSRRPTKSSNRAKLSVKPSNDRSNLSSNSSNLRNHSSNLPNISTSLPNGISERPKTSSFKARV